MLITQTLAKWRGTFVLWGSSWGAGVGLHWAGDKASRESWQWRQRRPASPSLLGLPSGASFLPALGHSPDTLDSPITVKSTAWKSHTEVYPSPGSTPICPLMLLPPVPLRPKESSVKPTTIAASGSGSLLCPLSCYHGWTLLSLNKHLRLHLSALFHPKHWHSNPPLSLFCSNCSCFAPVLFLQPQKVLWFPLYSNGFLYL